MLAIKEQFTLAFTNLFQIFCRIINKSNKTMRAIREPAKSTFHRIYPRYSDRYADSTDHADSTDPDQTAPKEQSDLGLHCLPFSQYLSNTGSQVDRHKFKVKYDKETQGLNI